MPDDGADGARAARVDAALRAAARDDGFVPYDRFSEIALYQPGAGFYERPDPPLGTAGEFYTAAHVSPLFGRTIARRILAVRRALGGPGPFAVVEVGPGDGTLAATLLEELARAPPVDRPTDYRLVERSGPLGERAARRAGPAAEAAGVRLSSRPSVGADGPITGVVLANEFLDAQPFRRIRRTERGWVELGVRRAGDRWIETEDGPPGAVPGAPLPARAEPGTVFEFSPAAEGFVREVADHLAGGVALLLDYGLGESELLAGHPDGTLAAVRQHRVVPDPRAEPGTADLSVFVDLDRIRAVARASGLVALGDRSQAEALGAWGFSALFEEAQREAGSAEAEVRLRLAAKNLLFGFDRFRALEFAAPASAPALAALR
ncbi:MAG TPA: SAM-dependent methyltransferase [Thermoplasmata archaeon]|nr:SAM-dependent methyltransferase [Thermoplasmata archaeon]